MWFGVGCCYSAAILCKLEKHDVAWLTRSLFKDQTIIFLNERALLDVFLNVSYENGISKFQEAREIVLAASEAKFESHRVIDELIFQRGADDSLEKSFYCRRGLISQRRWSIDSIQERPVVVWSRLAGWSSSLFQPWSAANSTDRSPRRCRVWASFWTETYIYIYNRYIISKDNRDNYNMAMTNKET